MNERKNSSHDIEQHRVTWRALGFIAALSLVLAVFAWTSFETVYRSTLRYASMSIEEEELPTVKIKKRVSKPRPPARQIAMVSPDPEPDPEPDPDPNPDPTNELTDFDYVDIDGDEDGDSYTDTDTPFVIVEKMPALGSDCAKLRGDQRKMCSEQAILTFFAQNVKYPARLKEAGVEGVVFLSFVVDRQGNAVQFEVLRSNHERFTNEVLRVAERMPRFEPGEQQGVPVSVQYTVPVRFTLK